MSQEIERVKTRLFALNLRLEEVEHDVRGMKLEVLRLERALENAQLAALVGESDRSEATDLQPRVETAQRRLEEGEDLERRLRRSRAEARVHYVLLRSRQRRESRKPDA